MSPSARTVGRHLRVWLAPTAVGINTLAQAMIAANHRDQFAFWTWIIATMMLVFLAASIESVKQFLED